MPEAEAPSCTQVKAELLAGQPVAYASCRALLPAASQAIFLAVSSALLVFGAAAFVWVGAQRHHPLIISAQPPLVLATLAGSALSLSAVYPASVDLRGLTAHAARPATGRFPSLDAACNLTVWLYLSASRSRPGRSSRASCA